MNDFKHVVHQDSAGFWYVLKFMRCENDFRGKPLWNFCIEDQDMTNKHESKNSAMIKRPNEMTEYEMKEAFEVPVASVPDTWLKKV